MFKISKEAKNKLDRLAYLNYRFNRDTQTEQEVEEYQSLMQEFIEEYGDFLQLLIDTGILCVEIENTIIQKIDIPWLRVAFTLKNFYPNGCLHLLPEEDYTFLVPEKGINLEDYRR